MTNIISYTIGSFAERHQVSPSTVRRWINQGLLESILLGPGCRRITLENEQQFLVAIAAKQKEWQGKNKLAQKHQVQADGNKQFPETACENNQAEDT